MRAEVDDPGLPADVGVHDDQRSHGVRRVQRRGHPARPGRQVRLPAPPPSHQIIVVSVARRHYAAQRPARTSQSCARVGLTHGLGWVGLARSLVRLLRENPGQVVHTRGWRQVRVPDGVDDERLQEPAVAVRHDEGRRQPRLQGLRDRHAARLRPTVPEPSFPFPAHKVKLVNLLFPFVLLPDMFFLVK